MRKARAFTLLEILVVVAIISLLVSITMPAVAAARRSGRNAKCRTNLHAIGQALQAYFTLHNDIFPCIAQLPSLDRRVTDRKFYDAMPVVLRKEIHGTAVKKRDPVTNKPYDQVTHEVFECPSDIIRNDDLGYPALGLYVGKRYFDNETTSYEWNAFLNPDQGDNGAYGPQKRRPHKRMKLLSGLWQSTLSRLVMVSEFEVFHGTQSGEGPWNTLYADGNVNSKR